MRRALQPVVLALGLLASTPLLARAHNPRPEVNGSFFVRDRAWFASRDWPTVQRAHGLAQLDSNAAGAALTLLVGSVVVLARKRDKRS